MFEPPAETKTKSGLSPAAERRVVLARASLFYERLWPRSWGFLAILLVFLGLSWFEVWHTIPGYVHALLLLVFAGAAGFALVRGARGLKWPTREEGLQRLELDSGLTHHPLQTLGDKLALGQQEPASQILWRAHLKRASEALERLALKAPRPDVARADPFALRVVVVAFAVLGLLYAGPDWPARIINGLAPDLVPETARNITVDAWITPPAYTGAPAIFLTGLAKSGEGSVKAPTGSILTVRVTGAKHAPRLRRLAHSSQLPDDWHVRVPFKAESAEAFKIEVPLKIDETVEVDAGRRTLDQWRIAVLADAPPTIRLKEPPTVTDKDAIALHYLATDDYAVASAEMHIEPVERIPMRAAEAGVSIMPSAPLVVALNLPPAKSKSVDSREFADLTASPWAGREVKVSLRASDDVGQSGDSPTITFKLPERKFKDPLARSLIEQRRLLAEAPRANRDRVQRALDALALAPERFTPDAVTYLGLRSAFFRLGEGLDREAVQSVYDLLWNIALHIEDGDLTLAESDLRDAQKRLVEALGRNAPDEEVQQLMGDLKRALDRYLQALSEEARKALARGETIPGVNPNGEVMTTQDLANMMNAIENMTQTGARAQARQLLSQLQSILENLQVGGGSAKMSQQEATMSDALKQLQQIVEDQRGILDETYRKSGEGGGPRPKDRPAKTLSRDQAELAERLSQLGKGLSQAMPKGLDPLKDAGKSMGEAEDELAANRPGSAVPPEQKAIEALQQGMQGLAQALAQSMGNRMAGASGDSKNRDPLGRHGAGALDQDGVKLPDEMAQQRARKILEELQRRASNPGRQQKELEYLDRLLKRF